MRPIFSGPVDCMCLVNSLRATEIPERSEVRGRALQGQHRMHKRNRNRTFATTSRHVQEDQNFKGAWTTQSPRHQYPRQEPHVLLFDHTFERLARKASAAHASLCRIHVLLLPPRHDQEPELGTIDETIITGRLRGPRLGVHGAIAAAEAKSRQGLHSRGHAVDPRPASSQDSAPPRR